MYLCERRHHSGQLAHSRWRQRKCSRPANSRLLGRRGVATLFVVLETVLARQLQVALAMGLQLRSVWSRMALTASRSPCASGAGTLYTVGPRSLSVSAKCSCKSSAGLTERAGPPPPRFRSAEVDGRSYGVAEAIASGSVWSKRNRAVDTRVCPLLAGYIEVSRSGGAHAPSALLSAECAESRVPPFKQADELRWTPLRSSPPPHAGLERPRPRYPH